MLNKLERYNVLVHTKRLYAVSLFPCQVDLNGWEIVPGAATSWKEWASKFVTLLHLAHCGYKIGSLVLGLSTPEKLPLHQAMLHSGLAGASVVYTFWYYLLHVKHTETNAGFVGITLRGDFAGGMNLKIFTIAC